MAYSGTTAASSLANPPHRVDHGGLTARNINESTSTIEGRGLYFYNSTNVTTDLTVTGFFSDADRIGFRNGDVVICVQSTGSETAPRVLIGALSGVSSAGGSLDSASIITSTYA
jgi:hypothetical protein